MEATKMKKEVTPVLKDYKSKQLSLFQELLFNTADEKSALSRTIELWDASPWCGFNRQRQAKIRRNGFLPSHIVDFRYDKIYFNMTIIPARIQNKTGDEIEYYPSVREELIESVLRKFTLEPGCGFQHKGGLGVSFTLHQVKKELKKSGHTCSIDQIKESLEILSRTKIIIQSKEGLIKHETSPLTSLTLVSRQQKNENSTALCHVTFNYLVAKSLSTIDYRQMNYAVMMENLNTQLARWLYKKICHRFKQASPIYTYNPSYIGIKRDSGMLSYSKTFKNVQYLESVFNELKNNKILMGWDIKNKEFGHRNTILNIHYQLRPSIELCAEIKRANKNETDLKNKI